MVMVSAGTHHGNNVPFRRSSTAKHLVWPADILEERLAAIDRENPIIPYCGGAIAATVVAFACPHRAGWGSGV